MRPREIDSSPTGSTPPPARPTGNLSSMVVRPSDASTGDGYLDFESSVGSPTPRRRGFERNSPTGFRRRSPSTSPVYRPYRSGSISPPTRRPRLNGSRSHYDGEFRHPRCSHGYGGGRGRGRFRNMSPPHINSGFGRANGGRLYGRGYELDRHLKSPFEDDEFDHRNDPNLSPREGDWICVNPRCGNLNFARRSHCNNCDQPRFARALPPPLRSPPRRGRYYSTSHTPWRSPAGIVSRGGSPLSPPVRRYFGHNNNITPPYPMSRRRDYDDNNGGRRGGRGGGSRSSHWPLDDEWQTVSARGGYDRRELSPLPRDRWARKRSRSLSPYNSKGTSPYRGRGYRGGRGGGRGFRPRDDDDSFAGGRGRGRGRGRWFS